MQACLLPRRPWPGPLTSAGGGGVVAYSVPLPPWRAAVAVGQPLPAPMDWAAGG